MATRKYDKTRLDLHYKKSNENLEFYISDTDTSDFYIRLTRANMPIKVDDLIIVLCVIDPSNQVRTQFISADTNKEGFVYCKLENSMKSQVGTYQAKVMLVYEDEKIVTDTFTYTVKNDMFVALSQEIVSDERFETLNDMLSEISKIKNQEEDRVVAESERVATMNRIESEISQLVLDINSKVNANITENTNKTDELISSVNTSVENSLNLNTSNVNQLIEKGNSLLTKVESDATTLIFNVEDLKTNSINAIEEYKVAKDEEINQSISDYKTSTTESFNLLFDDELLKINNDIIDNTDTFKLTINNEFSNLDSELRLNVSNFVTNKENYIDTHLQSKTLELTKYINDKNVELNTYIDSKNAELNQYMNGKTLELNNYINSKNNELDVYKANKNAEINKYLSDKETELNITEKTRNVNENRRETNEYSRGLNENTRKSAEDKRISSFAQMTIDFNNMIKYNNDSLNSKYDDVTLTNGILNMIANGVTKKSIILPSGGFGTGHTHDNKITLDKITEEKITSWDNKLDSIPSEYVTESELNRQGYLTQHQDISGKVDKVAGKSLISDAEITRLTSVTNYTHPSTHSPDIITQDTNNRFVTDIEKATWNNAYTHSLSRHAPNNAQKNSDITKEEIEEKLTGVISSHSHDNSGVVSSDNLVTTSIVGTTLTLTTDKYQTTTMVTGTTIVLPTVSSFTEIHLFFSASSDMTLTLPSCKWQTTPSIKSGKYYEFIFTYTIEWLGGCICYN